MSVRAPDIFKLSGHPGTIVSLADGQLSQVATCLADYGPSWRDVVISEILTRFWLYRANPTDALAPACNALPEPLRKFVRKTLPNQLEPQTAISPDLLPVNTTDRCWQLFAERGRIFHRAHGFLLLVAPKESEGGVIVPYKRHSAPGAWDESNQEIPAWSECLALLDSHLPSRPGIKISANLAGRNDHMLGRSLMLPVFLSAKAATHSLPPINPFHLLATGEFTENGLVPVVGMRVKREMAARIGAFLLAPRDYGDEPALTLKAGTTHQEVTEEAAGILRNLELNKLSPRERFEPHAAKTIKKTRPHISKPMKDTSLFERVCHEAISTVHEWDSLKAIITHAAESENDTMFINELEKLDDPLKHGLEELKKALENPSLTLAVAGTTSAGKSSFLNFLIGREILPVHGDATTYGTTLIVHQDSPSMIIENSVHPVPSAHQITDEIICDTLRQVFKRYDGQKDTENPPAPPKVTLGYPLTSLRNNERLNIPEFVDVRLLDLPGLESIRDLQNTDVIKGGTRQALGVILYNAEETDKDKQQELLEDLAKQVRDLGGSPARMLFVLNRIDARRSNFDWSPTEQQEFTDKIGTRIRTILASTLQGYHSEIEELKIVPFSAGAALLAIHMQLDDETLSKNAAIKAFKDYQRLISEDLYESLGLPGLARQWNVAQRRAVGLALWKESGAEEFLAHLRTHINVHLPEIIIPPILDQFWKSQAGEAGKCAINAIQSILDSAGKDYESKQSELDAKEKSVDDIVNKHKDMLERLVSSAVSCFKPQKSNSSNVGFGMDGLRVALETIYGNERGFAEVKSEFGKTTDWIDRISRIGNKLNDALVAAFSEETENFSILDGVSELSRTSKESLKATIRYMRCNLRYWGNSAIRGLEIKEDADSEHSRINDFVNKLEDLTGKLAQLTSELTKSTVVSEKSKIREAIEFLLRWHTDRICEEAQSVAGDFRLSIASMPKEADSEFTIDCELRSDYSVETKRTTHKKEIKRGPETVWEWITHFGGNVKHTIDVERSYRVAQIPGIATGLQQGWSQQLHPYFQEAGGQFADWLKVRLNGCIEHARTSLHADIQNYRDKLAHNRSRQKDSHAKVMERWAPIRNKAESWDIKADGVGGGLSQSSLAGMWRNERNETITIEPDCSWKREEAGTIHSGSWEFESPVLWLLNSDSQGRHPWLGMAGSHIWPRNDKHNKFRRISGGTLSPDDNHAG
jgi:GTPase SAR1 family protein